MFANNPGILPFLGNTFKTSHCQISGKWGWAETIVLGQNVSIQDLEKPAIDSIDTWITNYHSKDLEIMLELCDPKIG